MRFGFRYTQNGLPNALIFFKSPQIFKINIFPKLVKELSYPMPFICEG